MKNTAYQLGMKLALQQVSLDEAKRIGSEIGIDWEKVDFPPEQLQKGMEVEQEHGSKLGPKTDVGGDKLTTAARIAWAHLKEMGNYYTKLDKMEKSANGDDEEGPGKPVDEEKVVSWFKKNPNPNDDQVHAFAEAEGYNPHKLETVIYRLATKAVKGM